MTFCINWPPLKRFSPDACIMDKFRGIYLLRYWSISLDWTTLSLFPQKCIYSHSTHFLSKRKCEKFVHVQLQGDSQLIFINFKTLKTWLNGRSWNKFLTENVFPRKSFLISNKHFIRRLRKSSFIHFVYTLNESYFNIQK